MSLAPLGAAPATPASPGDVDPALIDTLQGIVDPCSCAAGVPLGMIDMGIVSEARIDGNTARVVLRPTNPMCFQLPYFLEAMHERLTDLPGIEHVDCSVTREDWLPEMMAPAAQVRLAQLRPRRRL